MARARLFVLDRTGSAAHAGLVLSAATLPTIVTAPLVGAWLDAHGRRRLAITVHLTLLAAALALMVLGAPAIACAGAAGLLQPLVTGGFSSMVPVLGSGPRPPSLDAMTYQVATVAGPALVGGAAALGGPAAAVRCRAASRCAPCRSFSPCPRALTASARVVGGSARRCAPGSATSRARHACAPSRS